MITLKGRQYEMIKLDSETCPYELKSGKKTLTAIRNKKYPDLIICIDSNGQRFSSFFESTLQEVNLL